MERVKQQTLNDLMECLYGTKNKELEVYNFDEKTLLNKKKIRNIKIKKIINEWELVLDVLKNIIDEYKEIKNKTEYFEGKTESDFDFETWFQIKKVNGRLTRYYNELMTVYRRLKNNEETKMADSN